MKKKKSRLRNTWVAVFFLALLIFFIVISIIFKVITVIRAGQFDDSKRFTLVVANSRNTEVISLSPSSRNIAIFKMADNIKPAEAGKFLEIPMDGFIAINSLDLNQKVSSLFLKAILNYSNLKTNLTIIDLLKLAMFARSVPESSIDVRTVRNTSGSELDKLVGHLVSDSFIEKDNQTIQIVNGTNIIGLGNRLARFVTNMGGNVIIVATSDSPQEKSNISYIDKKTYTIERLQKLLGFDIINEGANAMSDITITIGEDKVNSLPF